MEGIPKKTEANPSIGSEEALKDKDEKSLSFKSSSDPYALTMTFKYLKCKTPQGQFRETIQYLTKILNRSCEFVLYPEWRHTTGHIHYHGTIIIKDMIKYFKSTLPALKGLGFILIKKIDDKDKWDKYCTKEKYIAEGILGIKLPISCQLEYKPNQNRLKDMSCIELIEQYVEESSERIDELKE